LPLVLLNSLSEVILPENLQHFAAYLTKPTRTAQLHETLVNVLSGDITPLYAKTNQEIETREIPTDLAKNIPLRILVTEDNPTNQKLALLILEQMGYKADLAMNGLESIQALSRKKYDVIFMDVQMPEMDGLEATRLIRKEFSAERQPVIIAMTANALKEDRDICLEAGMDDYLSKPIQIPELVNALKNFEMHKRSKKRQSTDLSQKGLPEAGRPPQPILDPAAIKRLKNSLGKQAVKMYPVLLADFFTDTDKLIMEGQAALLDERVDDLRRSAHTIKSNSATFGAMAMSAVARELEYQARDGILDGANDLIKRLQNEFHQAKLALNDMGFTP